MPCTIWPFLYTKIICYLRWSRPCPAVFSKGEHHAQYPCRKLARKMALGWGFRSRVLVPYDGQHGWSHTVSLNSPSLRSLLLQHFATTGAGRLLPFTPDHAKGPERGKAKDHEEGWAPRLIQITAIWDIIFLHAITPVLIHKNWLPDCGIL